MKNDNDNNSNIVIIYQHSNIPMKLRVEIRQYGQ